MKYRSFIRPAVLAATLVLGCVVVAHAALKEVEPGTSNFQATGPGGLKIDGTGAGVRASEVDGMLTITVPVTDLKTGMDLRDGHLRDAIKAKEKPTATLTVPRASLNFPEDGKKLERQQGKGTFTLHGVSKPLPFLYDVERHGTHLIVTGKSRIDITAHGIEKPCYLGVCVEKDVKIGAKFKLHD